MSLASIVPAQWLWAFLGVIWTHSIYWPIALVSYVWFGLAFFALHRGGTQIEVMHIHTTHFVAHILGAAVGGAYVLSFRTPRLVDTRLFWRLGSSWSVGFYPWTAVTSFGVLLVTTAVFLLRNDYSPLLLFTTAMSAGVALGIIGLLLTIVGLAQLWRNAQPALLNGRVQVKYLFSLFLLSLTPVVYDALLGSRPFQGVAMLGVIVLAYLLLTQYLLVFDASAEDDAFGAKVPRRTERAWFFALSVGALHLLVYAVAWATDEVTGGTNIWAVFLSVLVVSLVLIAAILFASTWARENFIAREVRSVRQC